MNLNSNFSTGFKVRRQKFGVSSLITLLFIGVLFTGIGIFVLHSDKIDPNWSRVTGRVTGSSSSISDGSTTYAPVVQYTIGGQNYQVTSSYSSSSYPHIGDQRLVAYDPSQPNQAKVVETVGTTWFVYLFPIIGIAMLIIGPVAFVRAMRRGGDINSLIHGGLKLQGVITEVQDNSDANSGNYKIVVSATDNNGVVQNYVSDSLSGMAGLAMTDFRTHPIPVDVYIDPSDPEKYYVDISEIPNLTPDRIAELIKSATNKSPQPPVEGAKN